MKNKKIMIGLIAGIIILISGLCGCFQSVITVGYEPVGDDGTSVELIGRIIFPEYDFWNEENCWVKMVYGTKSYDNWEEYEYQYDSDFNTDTDYFYKTISNLELNTKYHFRAVAHWIHYEDPKDTNPETITQQGEDIAFMPGNCEDLNSEIDISDIKLLDLLQGLNQ